MISLKLLFPPLSPSFDQKTIEGYRYYVQNRSILLPLMRKVCIAPFVAVLPMTITPVGLSVIGFLLSAVAFYIAQAYKGRYPEITLSLIGACTLLYMIVDASVRSLAIKRGDRSHLTDFLQHYFHGFSLGFFSLIAISLFTSDELLVGPYVLVAIYLAAFIVIQEFTVNRTAICLERIGPLEALLCLTTFCFVCIPRDVYWKLVLPVFYGFGYLDMFMAAVILSALGTAVVGVWRSKLYRSPAMLLYMASCLLFIALSFEMRSSMMAMILFVLYSSELFGRMILCRIISPEEATPEILPLMAALIVLQIEPYLWSYESTGFLLAFYFIGKHLALAYYAFLMLRNQHQAL